MAGQVLTYSPADVKLTISGYTLTGIMSMSMEWDTQPIAIRRGIRGQNTRVFNRNLSAKLTVEVQQTSDTNDVLFHILRFDRRNLSARLDLTLSDNSGRTVAQTDEAYVALYPDLNYSMEFTPRVWVFEILGFTDGQLSGAANPTTNFFSSVTGSEFLRNIVGLG
ncbi:hypothetical protein D3C85_816560 [compost metagenome]